MKHENRYAEMSFPVGGRTYVLSLDMVQRVISEGWVPAPPIKVEWLPDDQRRQVVEARQKFRAAIAEKWGMDRADVMAGYGDYRPLRMEDR